jgi:hypothetical protein
VSDVVERDTGFVPSVHGFRFANSWPPDTTMLSVDLGFVDIPLGDASNGLCGGMAFAARDHFQAGIAPPERAQAPMPGDPMFDYLVKRLFDSFDLPNLPLRCLALMNPLTPDAYLGHVMVDEAWPAVRSRIDAGRPAPVCLVLTESLDPRDLGVNHQVLVYGYRQEAGRVELSVYDPNRPGDDSVRYGLDVVGNGPVVVDAPTLRRPVRCFFRTLYRWQRPPVPA